MEISDLTSAASLATAIIAASAFHALSRQKKGRLFDLEPRLSAALEECRDVLGRVRSRTPHRDLKKDVRFSHMDEHDPLFPVHCCKILLEEAMVVFRQHRDALYEGKSLCKKPLAECCENLISEFRQLQHCYDDIVFRAQISVSVDPQDPSAVTVRQDYDGAIKKFFLRDAYIEGIMISPDFSPQKVDEQLNRIRNPKLPWLQWSIIVCSVLVMMNVAWPMASARLDHLMQDDACAGHEMNNLVTCINARFADAPNVNEVDDLLKSRGYKRINLHPKFIAYKGPGIPIGWGLRKSGGDVWLVMDEDGSFGSITNQLPFHPSLMANWHTKDSTAD